MNEVIKEIIEWSQRLPDWQQDALRRLVEDNDITGDEIEEFAKMCLSACGWDFGDIEIPQPIPCTKEEDFETVEKAMSKCSTFLHDSASDLNEPIPEPDEIRQDIEILENWIGELRKRGRS